MKARITRYAILPEGRSMPKYVDIIAEIGKAIGECVVLHRASDAGTQKIEIRPEEWPIVRDTVDDLMANIKEWEVANRLLM